MDVNKVKNQKRARRRGRIRAQIKGTNVCPRLSVFRSNVDMFIQLIDDTNSKTLASVNIKNIKSKGTKSEKAFLLGKKIAEVAGVKKIKTVVFDRGGYKYHGRVKAVAEGAREGGLKF